MKDLSHYRRSYEKSELIENSIPDDPIKLFDAWFHEAEKTSEGQEVNAMSVATIGPDGFPKSRILLLKMFTEEGFVFFTNYNSDKGRSIDGNNKVCLSFFWPWNERQVIIKGEASKVDAAVSDSYFNSRPEGSRLGAIVSDQSEEIPSRKYLEDKLAKLSAELQSKEIKRPDHWGGYIVKPVSVEFWQGRANRLHDRIIYRVAHAGWLRTRLSP